MKIKFTALFISVVVLLSTGMLNTSADDGIKVTINGEYVGFDQPPVIIDGRTLVPIRADVYWYEDAEGVLIVKNEIKLALTIGSHEIDKVIAADFFEFIEHIENEDDSIFSKIELDVPPQILGSRTLLPIRAVCRELGAEVDWDEDSNTVVITCPEEIINDVNRDTEFFNEFIAHIEAQVKELEEGEKGEYKGFDCRASIEFGNFSDFEEYTALRIFQKKAQ